MISATSPTLTLNNGVEMPALGFGVFQTPPAETVGAVEAAIARGLPAHRHRRRVLNEREVGEGIRGSGIARGEMFIETKVWISDYGYDAALHAFEKGARKLGVDQLDLLLLHQPLPSAFDRTLDAYRALERLLADGKVRAIGVSNFMPEHLERLLAETSVVPAVNQIEVHPYFQQTALQRLHARARHPDAGVVANRRHHLLPRRREEHASTTRRCWRSRSGTASRPLRSCCGGTCSRAAPQSRSRRSPPVSPRTSTSSTSSSRSEEVAAIDALDTGVRGGPEPDSITLETYGREIPEA